MLGGQQNTPLPSRGAKQRLSSALRFHIAAKRSVCVCTPTRVTRTGRVSSPKCRDPTSTSLMPNNATSRFPSTQADYPPLSAAEVRQKKKRTRSLQAKSVGIGWHYDMKSSIFTPTTITWYLSLTRYLCNQTSVSRRCVKFSAGPFASWRIATYVSTYAEKITFGLTFLVAGLSHSCVA